MWLASTARIFTAGRIGLGRMELLCLAEGGTDAGVGVAGDLVCVEQERLHDG